MRDGGCGLEALYTTRQASQRLNVAPDTLHRWVKLGLVKAVRLGTRYRFEPSELERITVSAEMEPSRRQG